MSLDHDRTPLLTFSGPSVTAAATIAAELLPGHAGGFEPALLGRPEPGQLSLDEAPDAPRQTARGVLGRSPELPVALRLHHHPLGDPVLDHVDEEQGVAPCPGVELVDQTARKPVARQRSGHVPADARFAERCEWQLHAESVNGQLVLCSHDHVLVPGGVRRPVRPEHQQASGRSAAGQERQQLHGGGVAPVEVLENHDHGLLLREGFGRLGHLSHHSLTGGALSPERQGLEGCGVEEARNLGQPAGRVLFENFLQPDPAGSP